MDDELETPSDHEVLVCDIAYPEREARSLGTSQKIRGWVVRSMSEESKKGAAMEWHMTAAGRYILRESSTDEEIEQEVE